MCPDRISRSIDLVTEMELCLPSQGLAQLCIYTGDETPDKGPHILPWIDAACVSVCVQSVGQEGGRKRSRQGASGTVLPDFKLI